MNIVSIIGVTGVRVGQQWFTDQNIQVRTIVISTLEGDRIFELVGAPGILDVPVAVDAPMEIGTVGMTGVVGPSGPAGPLDNLPHPTGSTGPTGATSFIDRDHGSSDPDSKYRPPHPPEASEASADNNDRHRRKRVTKDH